MMRCGNVLRWTVGLWALGTMLVPGAAVARKSSDVGYRYEQVWSAAVRMVRVDLGFRIEDQDEAIGYVVFDYRGTDRKPAKGSVELIRTGSERRPVVRVVIQVPQKPSYIEQMLLDRLDRKLRAEFGDPPKAPSEADEEPPRDDDDKDDDDGAPEESEPAGKQP